MTTHTANRGVAPSTATPVTWGDPDPEACAAALSAPAPVDRGALTRRTFLQASAAGVGLSMLPGWMDRVAAAATPLGSSQGVLVLLTMDGGNDPLDTVVPLTSGAYRDARRGIAVDPARTLHLDGRRGLHPALRHVRARWDLGHVAVVDGIGNPKVDLSHFSAMADAQHGGPASGVPRTGWLGRYLDALGQGDLAGVSVGSRVPLVISGRTTSGTALPETVHFVRGRRDFGGNVDAGFGALAAGTTGLGPLADAWADTVGQMMPTSDRIRPLYDPSGASGRLAHHLRLAAGLINANLGIRVICVRHGGYDSHSGQAAQHGARMAELDEGLRVFHDQLSPTFAPRTVVLCVSEFGRRVQANGSAGTDHGAGWTALAVGSAVNGGFHGTLPSLTALTREGNLTHTIDYRHLYGTVLDRWLGADADAILGVPTSDLGFLGTPGRATSAISAGGFRPEHGDVLRLYRAFFDREPDGSGARYWISVFDQGHSLDVIAESFTQSPEFRRAYDGTSNAEYVRRVYRNVLGRSYDEAGYRYWLGLLDQGRLSRGGLVRWVAANAEFASRYPYTAIPG